MILDNQVLDVALFPGQHPGGKFVFTKNYGRDISKFFYGGYKLVQIPTEISYTHSAVATIQAGQMAVGHIEGQHDCRPVSMRISERIKVNKNTSTFRFVTLVTNTPFQDNKIRPFN